MRDAVTRRGLAEVGLLSAAAEAHLQFQVRLKLSKYGMQLPGHVSLRNKRFVHPSEEVFANLLDFYRVAWEYEPRSFPIQWDKDGRVLEAFTPDFYLPEFDLYVELTTMKQSLVTRKNRKVKLLRSVYPTVNIQVFYQKDFENLIFKYGLAERGSGEGPLPMPGGGSGERTDCLIAAPPSGDEALRPRNRTHPLYRRASTAAHCRGGFGDLGTNTVDGS